jgi:hypothetical protein
VAVGAVAALVVVDSGEGVELVLQLRDRVSGRLLGEPAFEGLMEPLTDNGVVYTARFVGGRNGFEYLLRQLNTPRPKAKSNGSRRVARSG